MKKKDIKFYPDKYKGKIGVSYSDYAESRQLNLFEDFANYFQSDGSSVSSDDAADPGQIISNETVSQMKEESSGEENTTVSAAVPASIGSMSVPAVIPAERTWDTSRNTMNAPGNPIGVFLTTDQGMTFGVQNNYEQKSVLSDAREVKLIAETK